MEGCDKKQETHKKDMTQPAHGADCVFLVLFMSWLLRLPVPGGAAEESPDALNLKNVNRLPLEQTSL